LGVEIMDATRAARLLLQQTFMVGPWTEFGPNLQSNEISSTGGSASSSWASLSSTSVSAAPSLNFEVLSGFASATYRDTGSVLGFAQTVLKPTLNFATRPPSVSS
jgi:hypothetical protein